MSNYKKVGQGSISYVKYAESKPGQVLVEGTYITTRDGTYGPQHHFRTDKGDTIVLNSSGKLNKMLTDFVAKGDQVRVTYSGMTAIAAGKFKGKTAHDFVVEVDSSRHSEVSEEAEEESYEPTTSMSSISLDDEEDEVETSAPTQSLRAVEETKKVSAQDILAKYRKKA
jgi:hypothetical protein